MGRAFTIVSTAVLSSALTSVFWVLAFNTKAQVTPPSPVVETNAAVVEPSVPISVGPHGLAIPVAGVRPASLVDTFKQARAGGARVHDAIDIMAPSGTPVVAAAPGRLEKLFFSKGGGGITAYVRSLDGKWCYYYSHLQEYAAGLTEGQAIRRGQPIGLVGYSGNANPAGPHLHFAINRMEEGEKWYQGRPVNPYPLLTGR